jgi:hypothetical protein
LAARGIRRAKAHFLHHDTLNRGAAGEAFRGREPDELDAFFLGVLGFALAARHVGSVAAVKAFHRSGALTEFVSKKIKVHEIS